MPSRKRGRKMCSKRNTYISKSSVHIRKSDWDCRNNIIIKRQPKDLKKGLYNYISRESWKVVPKDSLEVHKDRRKRKTVDERRKDEKKYGEANQDEKKDNSSGSNSSQTITRSRNKYNYRRSSTDCDSSSSCSSLSCCTSCAYYMDHE